ncbi:hypothetical protein CK203_057894 [Vitis vinifera]|uniref:Endonuclease/exonuclease/phosphatase domain-containing protein n=1 Tax=Vitis vinifera TaxID=29760 RepID=A0A438GSF6_VITVI|nr:hypothetical protein CK203_057894 [Vitis vinifera]
MLTNEALMEKASRYTEGLQWGCGSEIVGGIELGPLRMILADGREAEVSGLSGLDKREDRGGDRVMPRNATEGFEGEILFLLRRMKERKVQKGKLEGANNCDKRKVIKALIKKNSGPGLLAGNKNPGDVKGVLDLIELEKGEHSISCHFKNCEDGFMWTFTGVYGPTMRRDRNVWNELGAIYGLWNGPWCVAGDFNAILSLKSAVEEELEFNMRRFSDDRRFTAKGLPLIGGPFTWSGGAWWEGDINGSASFILAEKLKVVKSKLKEWKRCLWRVEYRKNLALDQLQFWDAKEKTKTVLGRDGC